MTYAQRLAQHTATAPSKETYNALKKAYQWDREANQKRPLR